RCRGRSGTGWATGRCGPPGRSARRWRCAEQRSTGADRLSARARSRRKAAVIFLCGQGVILGARGVRRVCSAARRRRTPHGRLSDLKAFRSRTTTGATLASAASSKHLFVTGGVASSLGKGLTASSLGRLLKSRGLRVTMQKLDPYLNVDPGTMNPFQHGEVFVTDDGAETDLDIGHYERFLDTELSASANVTTGQIYS